MKEKKKKSNWLGATVVILCAVVILQTLFLIQIYRKNQTVETALSKYQSAMALAQKYVGQMMQRTLTPFHLGGASTQMRGTVVDPFQEIQRLKEEMEKMRASFMAQPVVYAPALPSHPNFLPSVNFKETDKDLAIHFDVPGLDKDKIKVRVENSMLTVEGERHSEKKTDDSAQGFFSSEVQYGSFARSISLPSFVDEATAAASYDKGILTVKFQKKPGVSPKISQTVTVA